MFLVSQIQWRIVLFVLLCWSAGPALAEDVKIKLADSKALEAFYATREGEPLWMAHSRLNGDGRALLSILKEAWAHGLNPQNYHVSEVESYVNNKKLSDADALNVELMLTDGYVRYARDISGMRINPVGLGLVNANNWVQRPEVGFVLDKLNARDTSMVSFLKSMEPKSKTYQALKAELVGLVTQTKDEDDPVPLVFKGLVKPGRGYNNIPKLRERFGIREVLDNDRYTYDDDLAAAVMKFQSDRGLKADGIIGERTLHALNITRRDKIKQLIANLERLRWVPEEKPNRFIVVNIPSAMLWAIEGGKVKYEMPVIVGRPKRETPSFIAEIHGVRFNPTWTVPPTIKEEDFLPKLREDSGYFIDKGMELYTGKGPDAQTIDPTVINWNEMSDADVKKMHMVQIPGANNPLGSIRVLMPNSMNIYLHDTNHHSLFDKYDRAQSSGCVRMKDPEKIADFILSYRKEWKSSRVQELIKTGKTKEIYVDEKMPVYLLYYTAWVDEKDKIVYGMDIYNNDKKLLQLLEKLDGFVI